ncbi:MAG: hypothetical protein ABIP55_16845 [Tepidisphaeraceae bacterium]
MWGNRRGWTISAAIALVAGGLLALLVRAPGLSRATMFSADPRNFQTLMMPEVPDASFSAKPRAADDASALYHEAIELYLADRALYDDFAALGTLDSPRVKRLKAIDKLVEASGSATAVIFADRPQQVVNYDPDRPPIDALRSLGRVLVDRLALLNQRSGRAGEATKYAEAAFTLGQHLCRERVCWAELEVGLELLGTSTAILIRLAESSGDADRAAALKAFDQRRLEFVKERIKPTLRIVRSIDPKVVGVHAGDVFELARRSQERMWRVEAILGLGRLRFFAGQSATVSDQREATRAVTEMAESETDPIIRAAAAAARDLTVEKHRMQ